MATHGGRHRVRQVADSWAWQNELTLWEANAGRAQ
jgi:hypothetical protein